MRSKNLCSNREKSIWCDLQTKEAESKHKR
jgi:hypothetical protein